MGTRTITFLIPSDYASVCLVGISVNALLARFCPESIDAGQMELCVVEAVNNCIKHAYGGDKTRQVEVILDLSADRVRIHVCDTGTAMEELKVMPPDRIAFAPDDIDSLPESGMGMYLIGQIMDHVRYTRRNDRNILTMAKDVSPACRNIDGSSRQRL